MAVFVPFLTLKKCCAPGFLPVPAGPAGQNQLGLSPRLCRCPTSAFTTLLTSCRSFGQRSTLSIPLKSYGSGPYQTPSTPIINNPIPVPMAPQRLPLAITPHLWVEGARHLNTVIGGASFLDHFFVFPALSSLNDLLQCFFLLLHGSASCWNIAHL